MFTIEQIRKGLISLSKDLGLVKSLWCVPHPTSESIVCHIQNPYPHIDPEQYLNTWLSKYQKIKKILAYQFGFDCGKEWNVSLFKDKAKKVELDALFWDLTEEVERLNAEICDEANLLGKSPMIIEATVVNGQTVKNEKTLFTCSQGVSLTKMPGRGYFLMLNSEEPIHILWQAAIYLYSLYNVSTGLQLSASRRSIVSKIGEELSTFERFKAGRGHVDEENILKYGIDNINKLTQFKKGWITIENQPNGDGRETIHIVNLVKIFECHSPKSSEKK